MTLLLLAIPLIAFALVAGSSKAAPKGRPRSYYEALYRLEQDNPDKYTPGQRQFETGQAVVTQGALKIFDATEAAVTKVTGKDASGRLMQQMLTSHSEGDWGDLETRDPVWAAEQDDMLATGQDPWSITGIHDFPGHGEVWVKTDFSPAGNVTTFYLPGED